MRNQKIIFFDPLKKIYFSTIQLIEKNNQNIFIFGENRSGKTTFLKKIKNHFSQKEGFSILFLTGNRGQRDYSNFHIALHDVGKKRNLSAELLDKIEVDKLKFPSQLASFVMKFQRKKINYDGFHLNEIEKEIIDRLRLLKKDNRLLIFVDNFDLLDESSRNLLSFISCESEHSVFKFLKGTTIIATIKSENNLQENRNDITYKKHVINTELTKNTYFNTLKNRLEETSILELYKITNGKLGLTQDILNEVDNKNLSEILEENTRNFEDPIFKSIRKRLDDVIKQNVEIEEILKRASIIGEAFPYLYLFEICNQEEFEIRRTLEKAEKEVFISSIEDKGYFTSEYIFNFFSSIVDDYQSEYNFEMAKALRKLKSRDYYGRYYHLQLAGKKDESIAALIVYLLTNYITYDMEPNLKLVNEIQKNSYIYYTEIYMPLIEALKRYKMNKSKQDVFLHCKEQIIIDSPLLMVEYNYVIYYLLYKLGNEEDFLKCESLIINTLESGLEIDTDQWIRLSILLLLLYINRLDEFDKANKTYKKIAYYFAKNSNDQSIIYYQNYLKLISPALDTVDISKWELTKAINFFSQKLPRYKIEYIRALANLSGVYFYSSEFDKGFIKSQEALKMIDELSLDFYKKERILSNFLLCGLYNNSLLLDEVLEQYGQIIPKINRSSGTLFKNNYTVLKAFSGQYVEAFDDMVNLYENEKRDEYYSFLLGSNTVILAIVNNKLELALEIFENIKEIVPAISNQEKYEIEKRVAGINEILLSNKRFTLSQIEDIFERNLSQNIGLYWKKSLLLTDFQYWS